MILKHVSLSLAALMPILLSVGCGHGRKVEAALELSGANRPELEKVIRHYSTDEADSLKLKAAYFLIANMPGHYSYLGDGITAYYAEIDPVLTASSENKEKKRIMGDIAARYPNLDSRLEQDIRLISASYLIYTIDHAFGLWENKPWAAHLNFEQFCEYLLPYKSVELQQFDYWRDTMPRLFGAALHDQVYDDDSYDSAYVGAMLVNSEMKKLPDIFYSDQIGYPILNTSMYKVQFGTCDVFTALDLSVMRSMGLPVVREHFPQWGRKSPGHTWYSLLNNNGVHLRLKWGVDSEPGDVFFPMDPIPKIYRSMYSHNRRTLEYYRKTSYPRRLFSVFDHDITGELMRTSDLSVPVDDKGLKDEYAYIGVFNNTDWTMVDFGPIRRHRAEFNNMGRDMVYVVFGYDGGALRPISDPFVVRSNGQVRFLRPDMSAVRTVLLTRKFPTSQYLVMVENRIVGARIEASDDSNFSNVKVLYTYEDMSFPDVVELSGDRKYRYWRYASAPGSHCNISEVQFFEAGSDKVAKGEIMGTLGSWDDNPEKTREAAFDEDYLTSFDAPVPDGCWVGLDFGRPVGIDRVRCIPRSDDNGIHMGDKYQLRYWKDGRWEPLGTQTATERYLFFDDVPENALLLLRNLTRGREERIFTYENDKQVWW